MRSVPPKTTDPQLVESLSTVIARLERRIRRIERLLDEGIGAYLNAKFPYGDGKTDRWARRR